MNKIYFKGWSFDKQLFSASREYYYWICIDLEEKKIICISKYLDGEKTKYENTVDDLSLKLYIQDNEYRSNVASEEEFENALI